MKNPALNLSTIFHNSLADLYLAEKKYLKCFEQMVKASSTNELRRALSPAGTEIENHISRVQLVMKIVKIKPSKLVSKIDQELLNLAKEATRSFKEDSLSRDIQILKCAKTINLVRAGYYESIYLMASAQNLEPVIPLMEQCFKDNHNTAGYLSQIEQNIIYPAASAKAG